MKRHILTSAAAAVALAATLGVAGTNAQQPKAGAAAAKAAAPAAAEKASPSWVKLCEKAPFVGQDPKEPGKEIQTERSICLTHHERLDAASGMVLVSAAVREIEGSGKRHFMVMLPLGMALPPGMQVGVYPPDMWAAIQKGDKVDDSKLEPLKLTYTLCHAAGCTAEMEATPEVVKKIQSGAGIIVFAINGNGAPIAFPAPLNGFSEALAGAPADNKAYSEARKALMGQIEENRKKMIEDYRKQNQDLQKVAPKGQPGAPAPAATGAPAPKKP